MVMWIMSDRTLPRSLRMMEGFGIHSFQLINAAGQRHSSSFTGGQSWGCNPQYGMKP